MLNSDFLAFIVKVWQEIKMYVSTGHVFSAYCRLSNPPLCLLSYMGEASWIKFESRAKYVRTRYASVSQSLSTRRLSALTSLQTRNKSCSNSNLSEKAHNTRLQSIMEGMRESVTMPMLSSHLNTEDESDDEWWSNSFYDVCPYLWFDKDLCLDLLHNLL